MIDGCSLFTSIVKSSVRMLLFLNINWVFEYYFKNKQYIILNQVCMITYRQLYSFNILLFYIFYLKKNNFFIMSV